MVLVDGWYWWMGVTVIIMQYQFKLDLIGAGQLELSLAISDPAVTDMIASARIAISLISRTYQRYIKDVL